MTTSPPEPEATPPPLFAIDRCLGKQTPGQLADQGWRVALITDIYPEDAQRVADEDWLQWAGQNADAALTKDDAIRRSPWFVRATIPVFCLSRQDLTIETMVSLFAHNQDRIHRIAASRPGRQFWTIYLSGEMR
jgi:hypothetical protein